MFRLIRLQKLYSLLHCFLLEIGKVLTKLSKEKGNETLSQWIRPCENHFVWSATSTFSGNGKLIWAKFISFLSHVINKHDDLDEPLFNKCAHGEIAPREWLKKGMSVSAINRSQGHFPKSFKFVSSETIYNTYNVCTNFLFSKDQQLLFTADSSLYEKLFSTLTKKNLKKGIMKASHMAQTSCLEGFHSVLNHFAPKMVAFTYPGMVTRYSHHELIINSWQ